MVDVGRNQHRWKNWVKDDRSRGILEQAAEDLKWAWSVDKKYPESYPINTSHLLGEITEQLRHEPGERKPFKLPPPPPPPQRFCDLVDDKTIGAVYEDQNDGSYRDALKRAALGFGKGIPAWREIMRAVNSAYLIDCFGIEFVPKPRVHFLHRNLLALAESGPLRGMKLPGVLDFLDDICPCGKKHNQDAIRKLRKRWADAHESRAVGPNRAGHNGA